FPLIERYVLPRFGRRHGFAAREAPPRPTSSGTLPIERRLHTLLAKPSPAVLAPVAPFAIAAVLDELREALVRDGVALDPERRQLDDVRGLLVVVDPTLLVRPERERAGRNEYVLGRGRRPQVVVRRCRVRNAGELQCLQHRLL